MNYRVYVILDVHIEFCKWTEKHAFQLTGVNRKKVKLQTVAGAEQNFKKLNVVLSH